MPKTVLASTSPLAKLAPGSLDSLLPRVPSAPLETYSESPEPFAGAGGRFLVDVPKLTDVRGKIAAYAGTGPRDLPLVVHRPHGFGQVVFVASDLERARWPTGRASHHSSTSCWTPPRAEPDRVG